MISLGTVSEISEMGSGSRKGQKYTTLKGYGSLMEMKISKFESQRIMERLNRHHVLLKAFQIVDENSMRAARSIACRAGPPIPVIHVLENELSTAPTRTGRS